MDCAYLQKAGYYKLEVWGAQGGYAKQSSTGTTTNAGGYGGYSYGTIYSASGSSIYVVIGGKGVDNTTGAKNGSIGNNISYNGGNHTHGYDSNSGDGGGGGLTHISTTNCGELKNCSSYKGTYNSSLGTYDGGKILIVAGGGGGGSYSSSGGYGGNGGGYIGGTGGDTGSGTGGTQSTGGTRGSGAGGSYSVGSGAFGQGGHGLGFSGGSGGGGWFGGGGGECSGSGGGSGYIGNSLLLSAKSVTKQMYQYSTGCTSSTATATKTTCTTSTGAHVANAANTGNGYAKITYLGT